jgi:hypothetical protein
MQQGITIADVMPMAIDTGLFVSLCTIQQPSGVLGSSGYPDGAWVIVAGLVDIACMAAPVGLAHVHATEVKGAEVLGLQPKHVLLDSYYPTIVSKWRAVIDGVAHDIVGVEHDSQYQMTRMEVRLASI